MKVSGDSYSETEGTRKFLAKKTLKFSGKRTDTGLQSEEFDREMRRAYLSVFLL